MLTGIATAASTHLSIVHSLIAYTHSTFCNISSEVIFRNGFFFFARLTKLRRGDQILSVNGEV